MALTHLSLVLINNNLSVLDGIKSLDDGVDLKLQWIISVLSDSPQREVITNDAM